MYQTYIICNDLTPAYYIGMTSQSLSKRMSSHRASARAGAKSKLYDYMRKYGVDMFYIESTGMYETIEECCDKEIELISKANNLGHYLLNLAGGGQVGFDVTTKSEAEVSAWKDKLSKSRKGGKPFLGNSHTEETKTKCSESAKAYWEDKKRFENLDLSLSFKIAHELCGISKTHFYRLRKRAKANDLS